MMLRAKGRVRNGILQIIIVNENGLFGYSKRVHGKSQTMPIHQEPLDVPYFMKKDKKGK